MGWKQRCRRTYFYRSKRVAGRIRSEYVGAGIVGAATAQHDLLDRICNENDRRHLQRTVAKDAAVDRQITAYQRQVRASVAAALAGYGYVQHHRGEWRRSRTMAESTQLAQRVPLDSISILASSTLILVLQNTGMNATSQAALLGDVAALRTRLGWESAPEHERLLIEAIGLAWLRLQFAEQNLSQNSTGTNYNFARVEHFEQRLSLAHLRYNRAIETLTRVRRLAIKVQINVGQNQVIAI